MGEAMTVIRQYVNEMEALIARSVLEAHDVPAVVLRDDAGGMLPAMHMLYPVRLAVRVQETMESPVPLFAPESVQVQPAPMFQPKALVPVPVAGELR